MPYRLFDRLKVFLSALTDHPALVKWGLGAVITAFGSQIQQHACLAVYSLSCNCRKCPFTLLVRHNSSEEIHLCRSTHRPFVRQSRLSKTYIRHAECRPDIISHSIMPTAADRPQTLPVCILLHRFVISFTKVLQM